MRPPIRWIDHRHRVWMLVAAYALTACASGNSAIATSQMIVTPIQDAKFVPVNPALPEGPQLAVLWGDPDLGPSTMLLKLQKGSVPLHIHSSDYHLVVLEGTMKHWAEGDLEANATPLGPGSSWFQPGNHSHGDACLTDECLMYVSWAGRRDAKLAPTTK